MGAERVSGFVIACLAATVLAACSDLFCDPESSLTCDDEDECTPAPSNCQRTAPSLNLIRLEVSNPRPVIVRVYRGADYETGTEIWSGVAPLANWSMSAESGAYAATALYVIDGDSVLVVDGDFVEASALETCDGTCFSPGSIAMDLRLQD